MLEDIVDAFPHEPGLLDVVLVTYFYELSLSLRIEVNRSADHVDGWH